jgi:NodT family efflux transporter outer membrane factor (OMF) lipoprotein
MGLAALLMGCAATPPAAPPADALPAGWQAPLPHGGLATQLAGWWAQFDDPLLTRLIDTAQRQNPTLAQATARIRQARAAAQISGAARWPRLDARAGVTRSSTELPPSPGVQTAGSVSLDALWEIDLFGSVRNSVAAAEARAAGSLAQWHNARVSLAAEVANAYVGLRTCEAVLQVYEQDAASLANTAGLTQQKVKAGFDAPANVALANASAAEAANRVVAQRADCDVAVKQLVQLTVLPEAGLREQLAARRALLPKPASLAVASVPAELLSQRPDLAASEREIAAASADVGVAQADRFPRISLAGSIGRAGVRVAGQTFDGNTWSFGPGLLLPLFDAGRRRAAVDAAQARYDEAVAAYRERALAAVREVEESLVRLDAAEKREADAQRAAQGYAEFLAAAETQWRVGTGSLLDLEQARRSALAASAGLLQVQRERVAAWLALYKAMGGGWTRDTGDTTTAAANTGHDQHTNR